MIYMVGTEVVGGKIAVERVDGPYHWSEALTIKQARRHHEGLHTHWVNADSTAEAERKGLAKAESKVK